MEITKTAEPVEFTITIPLEKAESSDGGWRITGVAAGPEVDLESERLTNECIEGFARQINTASIPFLDWHRDDTILSEMGEVTKAWLDPQFHMGVEVKLDEDHPAAQLMWKKLDKGKQYGMSVRGTALDYEDEYEKSENGQKRVRAFKNVLLSEISATTRPIYTPSFGTVLRKAIDAANEAKLVDTGDKTSMEETPVVEETVVTTTSTQPADSGESLPNALPSVDEASSAPENVVESPEQEPAVAKAVVVEPVLTDDLMTRISELIDSKLAAFSPAAQAATQPESVETAKSSTLTAEDYFVRLEKSLDERDARIVAELESIKERVPSIETPSVLIRKSETEEANEMWDDIRKNDPRAALRIGLAVLTKETDKL